MIASASWANPHLRLSQQRPALSTDCSLWPSSLLWSLRRRWQQMTSRPKKERMAATATTATTAMSICTICVSVMYMVRSVADTCTLPVAREQWRGPALNPSNVHHTSTRWGLRQNSYIHSYVPWTLPSYNEIAPHVCIIRTLVCSLVQWTHKLDTQAQETANGCSVCPSGEWSTYIHAWAVHVAYSKESWNSRGTIDLRL